jgi:hypothetical protein
VPDRDGVHDSPVDRAVGVHGQVAEPHRLDHVRRGGLAPSPATRVDVLK